MLEKNIDRQQSKTRFSGTYTSFVKTSFQKEVQNDNMKKNRSLETSRRIELEVESRTQKILKLLTVFPDFPPSFHGFFVRIYNFFCFSEFS